MMASNLCIMNALPLDVFKTLLEETVKVLGAVEAYKLRIVCKLFNREIIGAMSNVRALEEHGTKSRNGLISGHGYGIIFATKYLANRILSDGKSQINLSRRVHRILEYLYPGVAASEEIYRHRLETMCAAIIRHQDSSRTLDMLTVTTQFILKDEMFTDDCLRVGALLGTDWILPNIEADILKCRKKYLNIHESRQCMLLRDSPIELAARGGQIKMLQQILNAYEGSGVAPPQEQFWTAIQSSVKQSHAISRSIVQLLLEPRYGYKHFTTRNGVPLSGLVWPALRVDNPSLLQFICERSGITLSSPRILAEAALYGHVAVVQMCLAHGANPNDPEFTLRSALASAAYKGHTDIVKLLLEHGADAKDTMQPGNALTWSTFGGQVQTTKLLLEVKAFISRDRKWSPFRRAACNGHAHIIQILLCAGLDIRTEHRTGAFGALEIAAMRGYVSVLRILLEEDFPFEEDERDYLVVVGLKYGHPHVVDVLVEFGCERLDILKSPRDEDFMICPPTNFDGVGIKPVVEVVSAY